MATDFNFGDILSSFSNSGSGGGKKIWAYLPEGIHTGRIIVDGGHPRQPMRRMCAHTFGKIYSLCPDVLAQDAKSNDQTNYPICEFCRVYEERKTKNLNKRWKTLLYFYLMETNKQSKYWVPNTLYVIVGNSKLGGKYMALLREDSKDPDLQPLLDQAIRPDREGPPFKITVEDKGDIDVKCLYHKKAKPVETDETTYISLNEVFVSSTWSLEKYERDVRTLKTELEKLYAADLPKDSQEVPVEETHLLDRPVRTASEQIAEALTAPGTPLAKAVEGLATATTRVGTIPLNLVDPPAGFEAPNGCPGFGGYDPELEFEGEAVCVLCDFSVSCLKAKKVLAKAQ